MPYTEKLDYRIGDAVLARRESLLHTVFERNFGIFATGFAAGDQPLRFLERRGIDEHTILLFGSRVEEIGSRP
jgi:hypothetical protein